MDNSINLNLIRLFIVVVETKTISEAARRLGMTRSNASKQLKNLEVEVGAQLLRRTTRHTEVTEAGKLLYQHGLRMLEEVAIARSSIDSLGQSVKGEVRIRLPTGLGHLYLTDFLLQFAKLYPDVSLRVLINDFIGDLVSAEVDLALKITSNPPEDHVARRICNIEWCLCAAPEFLSTHSMLTRIDELQDRYLITPISMGRRFDLRLTKGGDSVLAPVVPRLQSGDYPYLLEATLAGLGIALLPRYAVWKHLKTGALQEVLPEWSPQGVGDSLYLLTASNRFPSLATRTLIKYIFAQIQKQHTYWNKSA